MTNKIDIDKLTPDSKGITKRYLRSLKAFDIERLLIKDQFYELQHSDSILDKEQVEVLYFSPKFDHDIHDKMNRLNGEIIKNYFRQVRLSDHITMFKDFIEVHLLQVQIYINAEISKTNLFKIYSEKNNNIDDPKIIKDVIECNSSVLNSYLYVMYNYKELFKAIAKIINLQSIYESSLLLFSQNLKDMQTLNNMIDNFCKDIKNIKKNGHKINIKNFVSDERVNINIKDYEESEKLTNYKEKLKREYGNLKR